MLLGLGTESKAIFDIFIKSAILNKKEKTMAIDFAALLTNEQKRQLIENRIAQFAAEAYQHTLNLETARKIESESQIEAAEKSIAILETAIQVHAEELNKIPAE